MDARREAELEADAQLLELRQALLRIVRTLLADSTVELDANFFGSGGNSLLAVELAMTVADTMMLDLSLEDIFFAETIADIIPSVRTATPLD